MKMKTIDKEIDFFIDISKNKEHTKSIHRKCLINFAHYLSNVMGSPIDKIYLNHVYIVKDSTGMTITRKPIDSTLVDRFLYSLTSGSYSGVSMHRNTLGSFFKHLYRMYEFPNPLDLSDFRLEDWKPIPKNKQVLSRHDLLKFLHKLVTHSKSLERDLILFVLLLTTGCRISEILKLKISQINFENNTLRLEETKSKKDRIAVLQPNMGHFLHLYCLKHNLKQNDYLIQGSKDPSMTRAEANEILQAYMSMAGIRNITLHSFRRTFATLLKDAGVEIPIIQQLLGHSSVVTTKLYIQPHYVRNHGLKVPENEKLFEELKEKFGSNILYNAQNNQ